MALTFTRTPEEFSPVFNELTFICTTTSSAQPNFRVQVIVKDSGGTTLATQLYPVRPNGDIIVDVADIVQSQLSSQQILDFRAANVDWVQDTNTQQKYTVTFQEHYGTPPAATGTLHTYNNFAYNGSLRYEEFIAYNEDDYLIVLNDDTTKTLSAQPTSRVIREDESAQINVISDGDAAGSTITSLQIKTYTGTTLTQTATITNSDDPNSADDNKSLSILVGTRDLNLSTLATGSQPLITSSITSYTIQTLDYNGDASSELLTYTIDRDCSKFETTRLHFLNRFGGLDSFTFKMKRKLTDNIERATFKRIGYIYDGSYTNDVKSKGRITYNTNVTEQYQIFSDWINEDTSEWLRDLYSSPEVYWEKSSTEFVAINIRETQYRVKTTVNDRLFNVDLAFDLSTDNVRQQA